MRQRRAAPPAQLFPSTKVRPRPSSLHLCQHHCRTASFDVKKSEALVALETLTLQHEEGTVTVTTLNLAFVLLLRHLKKIYKHIVNPDSAVGEANLSTPGRNHGFPAFHADASVAFGG